MARRGGAGAQVTMTPFFLDVHSRRLFCAHFASGSRPCRGRVLVVPPFAEEMNKCRPLLARSARQLAARGFEVLLPDLFGTGDSAGEFADASWQSWLDDLPVLDDWLRQRAPSAAGAYLAVRSGALLLADAAGRLPGLTGSQAVLWQPAFDGGRFLQQFLRLRVMSNRLAGATESIEQLREALLAGGVVEVAGYALVGALATGLGAAAVSAETLQAAARVDILEFKLGEGAKPTAPAVALVAALQDLGRSAAVQVVDCEQFWTTQEIAAPMAALSATLATFQAWTRPP